MRPTLRACGVTFSTAHVDLVTITHGDPRPRDEAVHQRLPLVPPEVHRRRTRLAIQRAGNLRRRVDWGELDVAVVEYPSARNREADQLFGAVCAQVPARVVLTDIGVAEWRRVWLGGDSMFGKELARETAIGEGFPDRWPLDAYDALGAVMAWSLNNLEDEDRARARRLLRLEATV